MTEDMNDLDAVKNMDHNREILSFEQDNIRAYKLLLRIEIVLREFLKKTMESEFGKQWQKKLPGDLLKKIKASQSEENKPQFNFVRLGPLYYLSFGELLPLLQQKAGRSVTDKLGGDCFLKQLENLFAPRNAICHSRPVSSVGLKTVESLYSQIETALTTEGLSSLMAKPDTGISQYEAARVMVDSLQKISYDLPTLPSIFPIPESCQNAMNQFWWAEDSLAGFSCSSVENAIDLIRQYNALPTGVGSAGNRQRFCDQHSMRTRIQCAITELEKVTL